jgi:predicted transcriptional regulator
MKRLPWRANSQIGLPLHAACKYNVSVYPRFIRVDGERLRRIRQERALSLRDLGDRSGVSFDSIHKLETGRRQAQPRTVRKLAEALGVEAEELVGWEGTDE